MQNIQFIVLTCDKYLYTRVESIRRTWGKNEKVLFLSDSKSQIPDVIGYDTPKTYLGIQNKYEFFFKNYDFNKFDYYFFTDDDTFVNKKNLERLILPNKDELFAIVRLLCLNPDATDMWGNQTRTNISQIKGDNAVLPLYYPSGGSGFILSQSSCFKIQNYLKNCNDIPWSTFGDVSVGFWLRNCDIKLICNNNFWWDTHENLLKNTASKYESDENVITFHYVNENLMSLYNEKYNQY